MHSTHCFWKPLPTHTETSRLFDSIISRNDFKVFTGFLLLSGWSSRYWSFHMISDIHNKKTFLFHRLLWQFLDPKELDWGWDSQQIMVLLFSPYWSGTAHSILWKLATLQLIPFSVWFSFTEYIFFLKILTKNVFSKSVKCCENYGPALSGLSPQGQ